MEHEQSDAEEPRHYSQAAADAMHRELTKARARIRQLENAVGLLDREAVRQAETITGLRADVEHWRSLYMRACDRTDSEEK